MNLETEIFLVELKVMSRSAANIVCLRHPKYNGIDSPDLNCKFCCSKFVERIRSEQAKLFEVNSSIASPGKQSDFKPLSSPRGEQASSKRQANFDGIWI